MLPIQVSDMIGGETEIRRGDGTTIKAMGPGIGNVSDSTAYIIIICSADLFAFLPVCYDARWLHQSLCFTRSRCF